MLIDFFTIYFIITLCLGAYGFFYRSYLTLTIFSIMLIICGVELYANGLSYVNGLASSVDFTSITYTYGIYDMNNNSFVLFFSWLFLIGGLVTLVYTWVYPFLIRGGFNHN